MDIEGESTSGPTAVEPTAGNQLEELSQSYTHGRSGLSGCALLDDGRAAFLARLALAGLASRTLDVQYYLWHDDATGRMLARTLLEAADRGVRVRMLIDDIHLAGRDIGLAVLNAHRHIEIRIFNPFRERAWPSFARLVEAIRNARILNRRMHNKLFIADGCFAIVGGRNIGDEYFAAASDANFRDMDLFAVGAVIPDLQRSFEEYWHSRLAVPVRRLIGLRPTRRFIRRWYRRLRRMTLRTGSLQEFAMLTPQELQAEIAGLSRRIHWGTAATVYDSPGKILDSGTPRIAQAMLGFLNALRERLLIETAYFVPDERTSQALQEIRARGVEIEVLTNSLASNDVIAAHAGYASRRTQLLRMGVQLFEARSQGARRQETVAGNRVGSRASLHTKAAVFDGRIVYVGTLNLDPRSLYLNTEIGLFVTCEGLAQEVARAIRQGMKESASFSVTLAPETGRLQWSAGNERVYREPEAHWMRRALARVYRWLPIERML